MIEKTAFGLERNDEEPNIALAEELCRNRDLEGIAEIAGGLDSREHRLANDCIKVLYEIAARDPELVTDNTEKFLQLLRSPNNRLVWGAMTALTFVTRLCPQTVFDSLDSVLEAFETGSVITKDNAVSVLAELAKADARYEETVLPILLAHLAACRAKEIPQHAERVSVCIGRKNFRPFADVLESRKPELSPAQAKRVDRTIEKISQGLL